MLKDFRFWLLLSVVVAILYAWWPSPGRPAPMLTFRVETIAADGSTTYHTFPVCSMELAGMEIVIRGEGGEAIYECNPDSKPYGWEAVDRARP